MKILVLDNYDSFTYNLVHLLKELGYTPEVVRNDKIALEDVRHYDKILLSPGPGIPSEAGIMLELIRVYASQKSIFGVCLGHQAIGEAFGGTLYNMNDVHHGRVLDTIVLDHSHIFRDVPTHFPSCRYHSWAIERFNLPQELKITAEDEAGTIMGISHVRFDVHGVQFHPESFLTAHGKTILSNWLKT
ncbi:MAG: aminodeoxychorismate/anthranilate synthase component II [Cytophagales bacterium]|nr:aminodeoxychorismate/anthranilate synthase component II [Cytophagales bacterium]MDW8384499.1 aminodeoxychorismate/anthranilate synthase component II [Flammeovirgaceae bacterium]